MLADKSARFERPCPRASAAGSRVRDAPPPSSEWRRSWRRSLPPPRSLRTRQRSTEPAKGPHLPRDELGEQPVRVERAGDREQRRPERRAPEPHGPVFPADDWGDIIPPYDVPRRGRQDADLPGIQLDARRGRRSGRTAATRRRRQPRPVDARRSSASSGSATASSPTSATTTRTRPRSRRQPIENFFSPGDEDRGQPKTFAPGSHPDVLQVEFDTSL